MSGQAPALSKSAVMRDSTGMYRVTLLKVTADAARLQGIYRQDDDMYRRGGSHRSEWVQFTGSVFIERLGEDGKPVDEDVLLASEFNARFGTAFPVGAL